MSQQRPPASAAPTADVSIEELRDRLDQANAAIRDSLEALHRIEVAVGACSRKQVTTGGAE